MNKVKQFKFLITAIVMSICLILPGEMFALYIGNFTGGMYYINMFLPDNVTAQEMNEKIYKKAENNNIIIFSNDPTTLNTFEFETNVYVGANAAEYLEDNCYVKEGVFESLLSGKTSVHIHPLSERPVSTNATYYMIGNEDDMYSFRDAMDGYGCTLPKCNSVGELKELRLLYAAAWTMLILLCLILTLYECAYQKKENFVRMTLGENVTSYIYKGIAYDSLFFTVLFIIVTAICRSVTKTSFFFNISCLALLIMLIINALGYLKLRPKSVASLSGYEKTSSKMLTVNYLLKYVCVIMTCIVISSNVACIFECIDYYRQKDFFEERSDYFGYNCFSIEDDDDQDSKEEKIVRNIYRKYWDDMNIFYLCDLADVGSKNIIFANINTKDYLASRIEGFGDLDFKHKAYVLIYKNEKLSEAELERVVGCSNTDDVEVFYYDSRCEIVVRTRNADPDTVWEKNPIVVFQNDIEEEPLEMYLCMIQTDQEEWLAYSQKHGMTYSETNLLDYFHGKMTVYKRLLYLNSVLSAIMILIEILLTATVIKLEYSVNAVLLAVKKIYGYTDFERFSPMFKTSFILWLISAVAAIVLSYFLNFGNYIYVGLGALLVLLFDILIIFYNIRSYDKNNIQKILKGGAL